MSGESMSFDEWMNPHQRECFEAGAQSRQAEIDELQKRIDKALKEIESGITGRNSINHIVNILKGKENE